MQPSKKRKRTAWTDAAQLWLVGLMLAACGQEAMPDGNAVAAADVVAQPGNQCASPSLAMADSAQLRSSLMEETKANFAAAFQRACVKELLKNRPLIDPKAADQG